jgi:large subunit ribosomal protein L10
LSLNLQQKQAVVAEVAKEVAGAQAIVLVENRGLPVAAMTQLRAKARASGVYFRVLKNTLVRRQSPTRRSPAADKMSARWPTAWHSGRGEGPQRFARSREACDHRRCHARPGDVRHDVAALAALPSREELIAKLLGTMQAPVTKFVRTLNEVPARFVRTLAAVRDAKEAA